MLNPKVIDAKDLKDFIAKVKAAPGKYNYASTGNGAGTHMAFAEFNSRLGLDMVHVPYKGGGPAMTDLLAGRVSMYPGVPSTVKPHIDAGKLRALATTGSRRTAVMPDVPTVAESGYPGFEASNWYAFVASSKVPKEILDYWNRELVKALNDSSVNADLAKHGLEPFPGSREDLARYIERETETWGKVIREAKITAD
jgi:tripartite-type tricarboxylate transporter receptor subunit TctC